MLERAPLDAAQRLRAIGLSVIPVPRPRRGAPLGSPGDGKVPIIAWRDYQTRFATDAEISRWFDREPMNVGVVTGAVSGVVVIDADSTEALRWCVKHLPYTPWQVKTGRGFHLWYRHPGVSVRNRARIETRDGRLPIDVRGDGGYVVTAPSVHATGVVYTEAGDWSDPRERVPVFWPGWLQRAERATLVRSVTRKPSGDANVIARGRAYLAAIPKPEIGSGSDAATLYAACRLVRGFGLTASDAEDLLWEWAGGRSGWTRDWVATKVRHADRYGSEAIGALL